MKKNIVVIFILFSLCYVFPDELVNINKNISSEETISLENIDGLINITGWDKDEISIKGKLSKYIERLDLSTDNENAKTTVTVVIKAGRKDKKNIKSYLDIWIPLKSILEVNTAGSDVKIAYLSGDIVARSVSGDVECYANAQNIEIQTASGDITTKGSTKNLSLITVSGDIKAVGKSEYLSVEAVSSDVDIEGDYAEVKIKTVSGDINFKNEILDRGAFNVTSGDIKIDSKLTKNIDLDVDSMSGDVRLLLGGSVVADFLVGTFSGDIYILGIPKRNKDNEYNDFNFKGKNKSMKFSTGSDGGRISIQSFSGDISIVKKL